MSQNHQLQRKIAGFDQSMRAGTQQDQIQLRVRQSQQAVADLINFKKCKT